MLPRIDNGLWFFYGALLLCIAGWLAASVPPSCSNVDYDAPAMEKPTSSASSPRPGPCLRSSMSMPYFSFAQLLRPRS